MTSHISANLRQRVESRAFGLCEYCLVHQEDTYLGCQVDHVISKKHGGATALENLAYACTFCNRAKGSDIGSVAGDGAYTRFFNPRTDRWSDHFQWCGATIDPQTSIGDVTAKILGFNEAERVIERDLLRKLGRYPLPQAARLIAGEHTGSSDESDLR